MQKKIFYAALMTGIALIVGNTSCLEAEESTAVVTEAAERNAAADGTADTAIGMPNPMIPYASYDEMREVLGFRPLILPQALGYEQTNAFIIAGQTADLRYASRYGLPEQRPSFVVRTVRLDANEPAGTAEEATTLSGIYSVTWQPLSLSGKNLLLATIDETHYAACWQEGDYLFSCEAEHMNRWDFTSNVLSTLLDLTSHYYTK